MIGFQTAQAQSPDRAMDYGGESSDETKSWVIEYVVSQLRNMTNPLIDISEDGNVFITDSSDGKFRSISIPHPWTTENGYHIDNGVLIAPNGSQVFPYWAKSQQLWWWA